MLADHPIDVILTATDLGVARRFYGDRIGVEVVFERDEFVTFGCGGSSRLAVTRTSVPTTEDQTEGS
jgi:extradiol dioxygenase family protein